MPAMKILCESLFELAMKYGIAIGAHPSYQDQGEFWRVDMMDKEIRGEDLPGILVYQINKPPKNM